MSRGSPTENYSRFRTSDRTRQALLVGARDRTRSPAGRGRRSARADPVIRPIDRATVRRRKSAIKSPSRAFVTTGQVTSPEVCRIVRDSIATTTRQHVDPTERTKTTINDPPHPPLCRRIDTGPDLAGGRPGAQLNKS